ADPCEPPSALPSDELDVQCPCDPTNQASIQNDIGIHGASTSGQPPSNHGPEIAQSEPPRLTPEKHK
ncbi:hypothetical protein Dimus_010980, partial [Dionaea muscipula]